jgi:hypothetical protein
MWPVGLVVLLAAVALMVVRMTVEETVGTEVQFETEILQAVVVESSTVVRRFENPGQHTFEGSRTLTVAPDSVALSAEDLDVAVVLVQQGTAESDGVVIAEGHWALLGQLEGEPHTLVFADGTAPEKLSDPVWAETSAALQLEELRWQSLPARTLEAFDRLMEE